MISKRERDGWEKTFTFIEGLRAISEKGNISLWVGGYNEACSLRQDSELFTEYSDFYLTAANFQDLRYACASSLVTLKGLLRTLKGKLNTKREG